MVILKAKEHQAAWYQEPGLPKDWILTTSENGWTTDKIGLQWLKEVFEPWSWWSMTGAKRLLILDGHSSHQTADFDIFCKENIIICLCMPPYISYLLQPLDVGVFGPLKQTYRKLVEGMMVAGNNYIDKQDFLYLYPPAHIKVFTAGNICSGFIGAGLKPLDQDWVLEKITFQLRIPTLLLLVEGLISSAFQAPQNSCQLDYKIRSIQKSIQKRNLSSSPVLHIQHLEKCAQMAMKTNLLLQQEIKVVRAENERKIKKRARRHAPLGNHAILTVQEGLDRVQ